MQRHQEPRKYQRKIHHVQYERTLKEKISVIILLCIMIIPGFIVYEYLRIGGVIILGLLIIFMIFNMIRGKKDKIQPHEDRNEKLYRE